MKSFIFHNDLNLSDSRNLTLGIGIPFLQEFLHEKNMPKLICAGPEFVIRNGTFLRKDDSKWIQSINVKTVELVFRLKCFSDFYRLKKKNKCNTFIATLTRDVGNEVYFRSKM